MKLNEYQHKVIEYLCYGKDINLLINSDQNKEYGKALSELKSIGYIDGFSTLETFGGYQIYLNEKGIHLTKYGIELCKEIFN